MSTTQKRQLQDDGHYLISEYDGETLRRSWSENSDGKKDGLETEYYADTGRVARTTEWKNGVKHGHEIIFEHDYNPEVFDNKENLPEEYHENGIVLDYEFVNGEPLKIYDHPLMKKHYEEEYDGMIYMGDGDGWASGGYSYRFDGYRYALTDEMKEALEKSNLGINLNMSKFSFVRDAVTKEITGIQFYDRWDSIEELRKVKFNNKTEERIRRENYEKTLKNMGNAGTVITLGSAAAGVVLTVGAYMTSVYPSKEKAPEDKKVAPQEIKANQARLTADEARMFNLALNSPSAEFKAFMEYNKDKVNINAANENGETVLMSALANDKLDNAEYILEKFGDKIEYKARTNDGVGYDDIMKARLHSPRAGAKDLKINRLIKEGAEKENQQIKEGKARTTDSYAFYEQIKSKTNE